MTTDRTAVQERMLECKRQFLNNARQSDPSCILGFGSDFFAFAIVLLPKVALLLSNFEFYNTVKFATTAKWMWLHYHLG